MSTMRSMNPQAPNFINATNAASVYGDFISKPKYAETEKFLKNLIDQRDKIKLEERLVLQDERQSRLDEQNKQLFDLKISDIDRANKDREALTQFSKGMLQPQVISGIVTDTIAPEQVEKMSFTPEELAQYNAAGGDLSKLSGSAKTKAELQTKLSNFADILPSSPEYQENAYQQAQRVANGMELTPGILEELKKYQVADITAQKEAKKDGATYSAEAKELETKIAELKTKQGSIYDKAAGVGKEWGKRVGGDKTNKVDPGNILKYTEMVKNTDSAEELQGMIHEVFMNPGIPNNQKESIAANIVISSGAKLPQGLTDFGRLNVSVEDAQKATTQYLENLKSGVYGSGERALANPIEAQGINNEIALLEARRAGALAKANAYSTDRNTAARTSMGARIDELLGRDSASTGNTYYDNKAIQIVESKEGPLTDEMKYVISNEGYSDKPYIDKAGRREVETTGVGQTGEYKDKTFKATYEDRLNILKKQVPQLDNLPPEVRKTLIDNHYRGVIGSNTINLINEGKYAEAGDTFLKGRKDYNEDTPQQIKNRMDALANSLKSAQPKQDLDVKTLFANVKDAKDKEKASTDINKLTELYKSLGGTGGQSGSAGPVDDLRITREAENLAKELKIPANKIVETIKSQVRQEALTDSRNAIISKRMLETNMNKLRNDPVVQDAYDRAWREEARRRGYIGTSARPFNLDEFIKSNYSDKLQYK